MHQQDHRLRRRRPEILPDKAVGIDLVDQNGRGLLRPAAGDRVDHAEGLEEGVDDVDHQQEEGGGRQQRKDDGAEPRPEPRAVDGGGLDHDARDRLQPGQEEQEVVADPPPGDGDDDKAHRLVLVQHVVPVIAQLAQIPRHRHRRGC